MKSPGRATWPVPIAGPVPSPGVNARRQPYGIKTTEAHHYRRFVLQRLGDCG
ncbi:MAG: hypothetical protein WD042_18800 [Phycisphaeraceae bacterium]